MNQYLFILYFLNSNFLSNNNAPLIMKNIGTDTLDIVLNIRAIRYEVESIKLKLLV